MGAKAVLLCVSLAAICAAQQQDPIKILIQLRHKMADNIGRVPRYLCTEVVERQALRLASGQDKQRRCPEIMAAFSNPKEKVKPLSADRLRLDVALIDNRETYSWIGEGRFSDQSLSDLVKVGATSTGSFGTFLSAIFTQDSATFSYIGESQVNGRTVLQYAFQVPLWRSGYSIANTLLSRLTAYSGTFTADAQTLDLLNLEIRADEIPPELAICGATTTLEYTKLRINNLDFLLPSEVTMRITSINGMQSINRTTFDGCHEFLGESKLVFDDQPASSEIRSAEKPVTVELPAGLTIYIALAEKIDPASAAAGDHVKGRLTKPLRIPQSGLTIPKGTTLNGRICELLLKYGDTASLEFGLKWESMEFGGAKQTLAVSVEAVTPGTAKTLTQVREPSAFKDELAGYFFFPEIPKNYQIPIGFESVWLSFAAKPHR